LTQTLEYKQRLFDRLDAIAAALRDSGAALALLALGSVGRELERIDAYSDLDFFAIVQPGQKARFIENLDWLAAPIAFSFQNTVDGCKVLYEDGIYAEYAVFEPDELVAIPFAPGRIVWQAEGFDASQVEHGVRSAPKYALDFLLGEALTNLYVGLGRFRRGEKLAAMHLIQIHAVNQVLRMAPYIEPDQPALRDPYADERRFEQRFPGVAAYLPQFTQGYDRSPESARAILAFIEAHFEVNASLKARILELCDG
jgi:lincosamide nucleotidyltransferase B/F